MDLKSFSVVCTEECWEELAILIFSIRRFHSHPIYVVCDRFTEQHISAYDFKEIHFDNDADPEKLMVRYPEHAIKTSYHRPDCIYKKMDAIERATLLFGNTLFLDCDVIPVRPLYADITHPVMLSPHYYGYNVEENNDKFGIYNAGYVFNSEANFADKWRLIYAERSTFFEQQGMIHLHEDFEIGKFPRTHNVGFWRGEEFLSSDLSNLKSFHTHLTDRLFGRADASLAKTYEDMMVFVMRYLQTNQPEIHDFALSFQ